MNIFGWVFLSPMIFYQVEKFHLILIPQLKTEFCCYTLTSISRQSLLVQDAELKYKMKGDGLIESFIRALKMIYI